MRNWWSCPLNCISFAGTAKTANKCFFVIVLTFPKMSMKMPQNYIHTISIIFTANIRKLGQFFFSKITFKWLLPHFKKIILPVICGQLTNQRRFQLASHGRTWWTYRQPAAGCKHQNILRFSLSCCVVHQKKEKKKRKNQMESTPKEGEAFPTPPLNFLPGKVPSQSCWVHRAGVHS